VSRVILPAAFEEMRFLVPEALVFFSVNVPWGARTQHLCRRPLNDGFSPSYRLFFLASPPVTFIFFPRIEVTRFCRLPFSLLRALLEPVPVFMALRVSYRTERCSLRYLLRSGLPPPRSFCIFFCSYPPLLSRTAFFSQEREVAWGLLPGPEGLRNIHSPEIFW